MDKNYLYEFIFSLLTKDFFRLFFHWSWQVRDLFYRLIIYTLNLRILKEDDIAFSSIRTKERRNSKNVTGKINVTAVSNEKTKLIDVYEERMKEIEDIKVKTHDLNADFDTLDEELNSQITQEMMKYVLV